MAIVTVGIDLAKNVFAVHGVNDSGKAELVRPRPRHQRASAFAGAADACGHAQRDAQCVNTKEDALCAGPSP